MNDLNKDEMKRITIDLLNERGVSIREIAEITYLLQAKYIDNITMEICLEHIDRVLSKREVQHAVLTGIELDKLTEEDKISEPLKGILSKDYGLYGVDEILALSIVNVYGSIGLTNFGYVDKLKPGILGEVDKRGKNTNECHTFLDDIVGAIAASAASSVAHKYAK